MKFIQDALAKRGDDEQGFTLIELLVVVIIIGILAAIAIPVFLNQREKAWDSATKSDIRNMQTAMETLFTDNGDYLTAADASIEDPDADLTGVGFSASTGVVLVSCSTSNAYAVVGQHSSYGNTTDGYFAFDSSDGAIQGPFDEAGAEAIATSCAIDFTP